MTREEATSLQRVLKTFAHAEPDRVPFFLLLTMHGARELGLSIRDYFSRAEHVVEGQLRLQAKYRHDCIYAFFYAPVEVEAWGGEVIFVDDGPPNSGQPFLGQAEDIRRLEPPKVRETPCLVKVLEAQRMLKERIGGAIPIIGVVMSPFSLPAMQLGFEKYIDLILECPDLFESLMRINEEFCANWANAQLEAGATAICYFDPASSSTVIPPEISRKYGFPIARRTISRIQGPTTMHMASGRCRAVLEDITQTGTAAVGVSSEEDLAELKAICRGRLTLLGNLNGLEMRRWTSSQAETAVKAALAAAGHGGGFILSDAHGEIPWQVPDDVLMAISDAVHRWGHYPLDWIK